MGEGKEGRGGGGGGAVPKSSTVFLHNGGNAHTDDYRQASRPQEEKKKGEKNTPQKTAGRLPAPHVGSIYDQPVQRMNSQHVRAANEFRSPGAYLQ